jgi:signal transduction histidine kinase
MGLTSNEINEMYFSNDTMFIATSNGISVIPVNLSVPSFNIPVRITAITINQRDTIIGNTYKLGSEQQNIQVQFAGIEIDGHFKHLEYTLNNKTWLYLSGRILTLQLNSGTHILQVRAVDVHGHISNKVLTIRFEIATPFWKTIWFWLFIAIAFQALVLYFIHRWQKERKEIRLSKEIAVVQTASLEQQAFTSLMNPHFIFNALNSIQHYINLQDRQKANRYLSDFASLIRKNFETSQQSFISLEQELDNIKIYLRLEQMRFADRFTYHIILDEKVDTEGWMIPTMMLQPLLENAILHGIMPSTVKGELRIEFSGSGENLFITIADNGIGIQQSLASKQNNGHKSHGMELIRKRIKALGNLAGESITIDMSPAYPDATNPGNKIQLKIPAGLYNAWLKAIAAR